MTLKANSRYNYFMHRSQRIPLGLILGDTLAILILAIFGYLTHYAGKEAFSLRWMSTFLPFCLGWVMAAIPMGIYTPSIRENWKSVFWRAGLAAALAAPFSTMLRGFWLNAAVTPIFMAVLTAFGALAMIVWRSAWAWFSGRNRRHA